VGDLIRVGAVLVGVGEVLDDVVLHLFLHVGRRRTQLGHPVDDINHQVKAVNLIQNGQLQRGVDVALFLVAPHMDAVLVEPGDTPACESARGSRGS
jgi:hypothetical protein